MPPQFQTLGRRRSCAASLRCTDSRLEFRQEVFRGALSPSYSPLLDGKHGKQCHLSPPFSPSSITSCSPSSNALHLLKQDPCSAAHASEASSTRSPPTVVGERVAVKVRGYFKLAKDEIDKAVHVEEWGLPDDADAHYRSALRVMLDPKAATLGRSNGALGCLELEELNGEGSVAQATQLLTTTSLPLPRWWS